MQLLLEMAGTNLHAFKLCLDFNKFLKAILRQYQAKFNSEEGIVTTAFLHIFEANKKVTFLRQ